MVQIDPRFRKVMDKYGAKLGSDTDSLMDQPSSGKFTQDYETFRKEALHLENSLYERACNFAHSIIDFAPAKEEVKKEMQDAIDQIHLNITPAAAYTFAILTMFSFIFLGFVVWFFQ